MKLQTSITRGTVLPLTTWYEINPLCLLVHHLLSLLTCLTICPPTRFNPLNIKLNPLNTVSMFFEKKSIKIGQKDYGFPIQNFGWYIILVSNNLDLGWGPTYAPYLEPWYWIYSIVSQYRKPNSKQQCICAYNAIVI